VSEVIKRRSNKSIFKKYLFVKNGIILSAIKINPSLNATDRSLAKLIRFLFIANWIS